MTAGAGGAGTAAGGELPANERAWLGVVGRVGSGSTLEALLVAAITALLGIRTYLAATGFPQVGGGGMHVAHMLWGGLLLLVAVVLLLVGIGRQTRNVAAIVAGAGFGTFIDELGKFITSDNNYFFRPTVGIVYLIFVALFLIFRLVARRAPRSREACLANAADALPDLVLGVATAAEGARVLRLLEQSGERGPLTRAIRDFVAAAPAAAAVRPSLTSRLADRGKDGYERLIASRWFGRMVVVLFVAGAVTGGLALLLLGIGAAVAVATGDGQAALDALGERDAASDLTVSIVSGVTSLASIVCGVAGAVTLRRNRLTGLRWFHHSILITLLLNMPITFLVEQFAALANLAFNLLLWVGVNYLIRQETLRRDEGRSAPAGAGPGDRRLTV